MAYVVVEGIDFSGKSTFIEKLVKAIKDKYVVDVVVVKEPSDHNDRCKEIRKQHLFEEFPVEKRMGLLLEQRESLLREIVLPSLGQGKFVISDRSFISNMVYQHQEGLGLQDILQRNLDLLNGLSKEAIPDYGLLLEIDHETFVRRSKARPEIDVLETPLLVPNNFNKVKGDYLSAMVFSKTLIKDFDWGPADTVAKTAEQLARRYNWKEIADVVEEPAKQAGVDMSQYFVPA